MATRVWGLSKKEVDYRPARQPEVRCDHWLRRQLLLGPAHALST